MAQRLLSLMRSFFQLENRSCFRLQTSMLGFPMLECLPDETLLIIFNYLNIQELLMASHVSKNIRRICYDKSLWKIVDLSGRKVKAEFIKAILENDCENLNLRHTQIDGSIKLSKTSKLMCLNLDIRGREVSKTFFNEILLSCCSLQKLVLGEPGDVLDTALLQRIFSQNGQTLEALDFGSSYFEVSESMILVQLILTHCTKLQEIYFEHCGLHGTHLHHDALSQLAIGLSPEIKKIVLHGSDQVTDEIIKNLVSRCNKITALDIGNWGYNRQFSAFGNSSLTNNAITSILNHLKNLTELDITGCPNIELEKVLELESLPKLQVLNYGLEDLSFQYYDEMPGLMKKLPHLIINKKVDGNIISVGGGIAKI